MDKKKAIIISVILGLIALLEIGSAVGLLFYGREIKEQYAAVQAVTEGSSVNTADTETVTPEKTSDDIPNPTQTGILSPVSTDAPGNTQTPVPDDSSDDTNTPLPGENATSTPAVTPSSESTPTLTPALTLTPAPAQTFTPAPSQTPTPVSVKTPAPTQTPTSVPVKTPTPTAAGTLTEGTVVAAPSVCGRLHVSGTCMADENGNAVQLKGISTAGLQWFPQFVDQKAFHEFRYEWGVNVIRLALYTHEGGYCSGGNKASLKAVVEKGVEYATAEDMYVIIDWHVLNECNPNTYKSEALVFFDEMSAKYSGYNNVIYEICNEPNGGVSWSTIKAYAEDVIKTIRANDPNAIIVVGTPTWSQEVDKAAADPITDYDNIMYTLHFYAGTHKDSLRSTMESAIKKGLPIFVTEYGITDASGNGACNETEADKWMALLDKYCISSCIWNLANKNESSCLILSSCSKTNGFTLSDLSTEGKWFYNTVTSGNGGLIGEVPDFSAVDGGDSDAGGSNENSGNTTGTGQSTEENDSTLTPEAVTGTEYEVVQGELTLILTLSNTWGGETCGYQYDVTVKNTGTVSVDAWSITISFVSDIVSTQNWCCTCDSTENTVTLSCESWNGHIDAGGSVTGIGLIVVSDEKERPE